MIDFRFYRFLIFIIALCCISSFTPLWSAAQRYDIRASANLRLRNLKCQILTITRKEMRTLVPTYVRKEQWASYWGMNSMERVQKVILSAICELMFFKFVHGSSGNGELFASVWGRMDGMVCQFYGGCFGIVIYWKFNCVQLDI